MDGGQLIGMPDPMLDEVAGMAVEERTNL